MVATTETILSDDERGHLIPQSKDNPPGSVDFMERTGIPWTHLPESFYVTIHRLHDEENKVCRVGHHSVDGWFIVAGSTLHWMERGDESHHDLATLGLGNRRGPQASRKSNLASNTWARRSDRDPRWKEEIRRVA